MGQMRASIENFEKKEKLAKCKKKKINVFFPNYELYLRSFIRVGINSILLNLLCCKLEIPFLLLQIHLFV
jgi:hypothetical protein